MPERDPAATVRAYYEALRSGDPLAEYFADRTADRKFGISEQLTGFEAIRNGLRRQTQVTSDWRIQSHDLSVVDRECHAWFSDTVDMAWTNTETGAQYAFASRWSGMLEYDAEWRFIGMHVSTPHEL